MNMKIRKKLPYYIMSAVALAVICSFGVLFDDGKLVSVIDTVINYPKELSEHSMYSAFRAGMNGTIDMLLPVCCAIPSASYIHDEIKSGMISYVQMRRGKYRYIYSIYVYSAVSGTVSVLMGLAVYMIFTACFFPFELGGVMEPTTVFGVIMEMGLLILNKMMYGAAMAVCASFLVCIYNNLYFVLSVLFIIAYVARDIFFADNIMYFIITLLIVAVLYGVMWRYRGERI